MKITVAIPCYNLEDRISACLESVIAQDHKDIEILVIDDCSSDKSVEVINSLIERHPEREFHLIVNETNLGLCKVRNLAIKEASGEYLFFVDGDDTIEKKTLSLFHQRMKETNAEVICGSYRKKGTSGNILYVKHYLEDSINGDYALATYVRKYAKLSFRLAVWNNLYRLDFLRAHDICCSTNYRTYESGLFTFKVALYAQHISFIYDITYNQFNVPTSVTHQKKGQAFLHTIQAVIKSVFDEKRNFESKQNEQITHLGILFMLSNICLTNGLLKTMLSDMGKDGKKQFLRWLKEECRTNDMKWSSVVGTYNKIAYILLFSPFPYSLLRFYLSILKDIIKIVEYYNKNVKKLGVHRINK